MSRGLAPPDDSETPPHWQTYDPDAHCSPPPVVVMSPQPAPATPAAVLAHQPRLLASDTFPISPCPYLQLDLKPLHRSRAVRSPRPSPAHRTRTTISTTTHHVARRGEEARRVRHTADRWRPRRRNGGGACSSYSLMVHPFTHGCSVTPRTRAYRPLLESVTCAHAAMLPAAGHHQSPHAALKVWTCPRGESLSLSLSLSLYPPAPPPPFYSRRPILCH